LEQVERIMVISDGCVATEGTHSDLLEHSALYRRLVLRGEEQ
jgi:ABC-type multidrug transport system fused ATPase/permease subunit